MAKRINDIVTVIQLTLNKERRGTIKVTEITKAIEAASYSLLSDCLKDFRETGQMPDKLYPFKKKVVLTFSSGTVAIPADFVEAISFESIISSIDYEGVIARSDAQWASRDIKDLIDDGDPIPRPKSQFNILLSTISLTTGVGDLPENFIKDLGVFDAADKEGIILDNDEYLDRKGSAILPADVDNPIARVYDGKIEVAPSSISSIKLPHFAHPVDKRAIIRIDGANVEIKPATITSGTLYYIRTETPFVYATTNPDSRTVSFDEAGTTDIEWGANAMDDLINRALIYLGVKSQNAGVAQIGPAKTILNKASDGDNN